MEVLQVPSELEKMQALYRERKPKRVLEIGTWDGGTLREWIAGTPSLVVSVDLDHKWPDEFQSWCKPRTKLHLITGDSLAEETKDRVRALAPFDWCFIDGDHGYTAAMSDAQLAIDCAAPNAILLFHDIADQIGDGPLQAFNELGQGHKTDAYVDDNSAPWGHGIGVIWL